MTQIIEIWTPPDPPPGEDNGGNWSPPADGTNPDTEPSPDEAVRVWTTDQLRVLIRNLKPYIDGTFGTVSTKHAQVYMSAVRELNKLWRAYYQPPPQIEDELSDSDAEVARMEAASVTRNKVLDQLQELRNRARP